MDDFVQVMTVILRGFRAPFTVYGYTFSLWQIFLVSLFGSIIVGFIGDILHLR